MTAMAVERPSNDARIKAALYFAEHGFGILACWSTYATGMCRCPKRRQCKTPGKHPIGEHGLTDATREHDRIVTLLSAGSDPNYGMVPPPGVFILDVDGEGVARLAELEALYGPLPATLRTNTRNGQHVFLRWPDDLPRPIGQMFGYITRWGTGSNVGYVIGPRSVHESGFVYTPADATLTIATLPDAWVQAVLARPETRSSDSFLVIEGEGYQLPDEGYTGSRYEAIRAYVASRYKRGISLEETWVGVRDVLAPRFAEGLPEADLRDRFDRAWRGTPQRLGEPVVFDVSKAVVLDEQPAIEAPPGWPDQPDPAVFHGVLGDIVRAAAPHTEADPVSLLGTLLAVTGACMGGWRTIYQGSTQKPNLFVVLVGETGTARKGTANAVVGEVMNAAYPDWERLIAAGLGSGEGLIGKLQRAADAGDGEHRALVKASEFGGLLTVMNREGSTLSAVLRDAWDGVPMGRTLAREQSLVLWHHVAVLGHVTPVELRQKLNNTDAGNGFGNRFLWFAVRRTKLIPFPQSPLRYVQPFIEPLRSAIQYAHTKGESTWTRDAADRWEALYARLAATPRHGLSGALTARAEAQIVRIALLYSLLDQSPVIDIPHLEAAEALWAFAERSVHYIFGQSTGNKDADSLLALVTSEGPVDWDSAKKAIGIRHAADLSIAYGLLHDRGQLDITVMARQTGGRPRRVIHLTGANPANTANTQDPTRIEKEEKDS